VRFKFCFPKAWPGRAKTRWPDRLCHIHSS
jgi:hypothetical protein